MTSRRSFLRQMMAAGVGSMLLPAAATYQRRWRVADAGLIVPDFETIYTGRLMTRLLRNELRRAIMVVHASVGVVNYEEESDLLRISAPIEVDPLKARPLSSLFSDSSGNQWADSRVPNQWDG